jgi:acetate kinase
VRLLVVNAGSSSVKLRVLDEADRAVRVADLPADSAGVDEHSVAAAVRDWPQPDAVVHRIVHGGTEFSSAVRIDGGVRARLRALTDLAPLHQPKSIAALEAVSAAFPETVAIACFDTGFHATLPAAAATYAVPQRWRSRYGARRYGFHGLSHAYASRRALELTGVPMAGSKVVSCHLGAGASLCAVASGRSVDTTMGFTPLEGLVMATRSGTVDPGLLLWLAEHEQLSPHEIATALETESGLLALAGTADMREAERRAAAGDDRSRLALDVYGHRLAAGIAAMTATLGGLDVVLFTGGVGEHSATVRADAARRLAWLGVALEDDRNAAAEPDAEVGSATAAVRCVVIAAREDVQMAHEARQLLATGPSHD